MDASEKLRQIRQRQAEKGLALFECCGAAGSELVDPCEEIMAQAAAMVEGVEVER